MTIIALEGIDGAGKTSILESLKNKYESNENIIFIKSPLSPFSDLVSDFWNTPPFVRMMFFLLSNYHLSKSINNNKTYVLDRYTYSTFVTHLSDIDREEIKLKFNKMEIKSPDKTFLIEASIEEIKKRLRIRNNEVDNALNINDLYPLYYKNPDKKLFQVETLMNNNQDEFIRNISIISEYIDNTIT